MKLPDSLDVPVVLLLLMTPMVLRNEFIVSAAVVAAIYSVLTLSWFFLERQAGWVSLSHSIPFGLAAYAVAIDPVFLLPAFTLSLILFLLTSKLGRERFTFATFILTVVFWYISHYFVVKVDGHYIGGEEGFSFESIGTVNAYMLSATLVAVTLIALYLISKSPLGLKIAAVRDDELAARSIGIGAEMVKTISFTISAIFATLAGICYILYFGHVSPEVFSIEVSLIPFIASLLAGRRWMSPVVGSYAIVMVSRAFAGLPEAHLILYALVLIISPWLNRWWDVRSG
ncbi:branched-chain amino acid ABC transporter permease [Geoglobus acetivorans]|uniref:Branched-chain amino acid ABC transporter permease n=1 Tax=Geoglobus acetivorans TaxID=565033 RepID=A0ABZ3H106_GEOAI|nr:branched-chain amino acid ABC transporter permease [Geoglobus acetivorans]